MKTTKKTVAPTTDTIYPTGASPEALQHPTLWVVAQKVTRAGAWTLVAAVNGEHVARLVFDTFTTSDAHVALIPATNSGGFIASRAYDEVEDCEGEASYKARAPKAIEEWDDRRRVR